MATEGQPIELSGDVLSVGRSFHKILPRYVEHSETLSIFFTQMLMMDFVGLSNSAEINIVGT